jgi:hypothetical protein
LGLPTNVVIMRSFHETFAGFEGSKQKINWY